MLKDAEEFAE